ncbi:unnamed protein product [Caenorhabditis bovis]|uniref:NADP-dependent oxidoreductase domain-containing protein n=1 Tax=Caenorhabditis bovis TaxID=2654633 RepID=A0A8S1EPY9_9PELO|nr:unnamed protein product [Caenorhabditis bovis]
MTIMPKISLGTYLAHGQQLEKAVEYALKCGYRGFDTAKFYENERDLGMALKQVILSWALQSGAYIVPKSVTEKRIEENFKISKLSLHEMNEINALDRECPYTEDNGWLCV